MSNFKLLVLKNQRLFSRNQQFIFSRSLTDSGFSMVFCLRQQHFDKWRSICTIFFSKSHTKRTLLTSSNSNKIPYTGILSKVDFHSATTSTSDQNGLGRCDYDFPILCLVMSKVGLLGALCAIQLSFTN